MRATLRLLRLEPRARLFFASYAQSALGNGAGYVALVVLAYDRWRSPWAIALVLLADFIPAMLLGPVFGAAADRWSRRWVAIVTDVARAVAFIGVALVGGIEATIAFALLAGAGAGLFTPAILAALPSLVEAERLPAATSLYGALTDLGRMLGPALAALGLAVASSEAVAFVNGVTFLVSALVLATVRFGERTEPDKPRQNLLRAAREGVTATARMQGIPTLILASSGLILFAAMLSVSELLVAEDLGAGETGYSILVAAAGFGFIVGSLSGAGGASLSKLKRRYLAGVLVMGLALAVFAVASVFVVAVVGLALTGLGNGLFLTHERLIFQRVVPDELMGRAFALADTGGSWAFAIAFIASGALLSHLGTEPVLLGAAVGALGIWLWAAYALRDVWKDEGPPPGPLATAVGPATVAGAAAGERAGAAPAGGAARV